MMTWENIYRLQQMEKIIDERKKHRDLINRNSMLKIEKEDIQKEINLLKHEKDKYNDYKNQINKLELENERLKSMAKEHEVKLYSGDITNNKELITAKEQQDQYQASISNLEDQLFNLMEEQDRKKKDLELKVNELRDKKDNFQRKYNEYQTDKEKESNEISKQELELMELKQSLIAEDGDSLGLYEQLKDKYSYGVIAKIENAICLGCHMGVSFEVVKDLRKPDRKEPVFCNNCGRVVIL